MPQREGRRHDFDYTMLNAYTLCPRKFNEMFNNNRVSKREQTATNFGSAIHKGLDTWYQTKDVEQAVEVFKANYKEQLELDNKRTHKLGEWIIRNYHKTYIDQPWTLIKSEFPFEVQILGDTKYIGRIDKIIEWSGAMWIVDHKTTSGIGIQFTKTAEPNAQFTGYVWAARKHNYPVIGIILDGMLVAKGLLESQYRDKLTPLLRYDSYRSDEALRDFESLVCGVIAQIDNSYSMNFWEPKGMLNGACTYYGECPFRKACLEDGESRQKVLEAEYRTRYWDPRKTGEEDE